MKLYNFQIFVTAFHDSTLISNIDEIQSIIKMGKPDIKFYDLCIFTAQLTLRLRVSEGPITLDIIFTKNIRNITMHKIL